MKERTPSYETNFLQEVSNTFPLGTFESHGLKELDDMLARTLIHNLSIRDKNDVVEEIISLRSRLKQ